MGHRKKTQTPHHYSSTLAPIYVNDVPTCSPRCSSLLLFLSNNWASTRFCAALIMTSDVLRPGACNLAHLKDAFAAEVTLHRPTNSRLHLRWDILNTRKHKQTAQQINHAALCLITCVRNLTHRNSLTAS